MQHRKDDLSGKWDKFCWFGAKRVNKVGAPNATNLKQLEAIIIAITNPGFNKQSGSFKGAKLVEQVPHRDAEGSLETKIDRMRADLEKIDEIKAARAEETNPTAKKRKKKKRKTKKAKTGVKAKAKTAKTRAKTKKRRAKKAKTRAKAKKA